MYILKALVPTAEMLSVALACTSLLWLPHVPLVIMLPSTTHHRTSKATHINNKLISWLAFPLLSRIRLVYNTVPGFDQFLM